MPTCLQDDNVLLFHQVSPPLHGHSGSLTMSPALLHRSLQLYLPSPQQQTPSQHTMPSLWPMSYWQRPGNNQKWKWIFYIIIIIIVIILLLLSSSSSPSSSSLSLKLFAPVWIVIGIQTTYDILKYIKHLQNNMQNYTESHTEIWPQPIFIY